LITIVNEKNKKNKGVKYAPLLFTQLNNKGTKLRHSEGFSPKNLRF
jgi:hypothetical protein